MKPKETKYDFLVNYLDYKVEHNRMSGYVLANQLYRLLTYWIDAGKPEEDFLQEFQEFSEKLENSSIHLDDLIDLGLIQTIEAINSHSDAEEAPTIQFYIREARNPFLAFMGENAYRLLKNIDFSEIDFQIFSIIEGDFPHDSAQNFLMENAWADIWTTLRYLDNLDNEEQKLTIMEKVIGIRKTLPEKLIFLAYLYLSTPKILMDYVDEGLHQVHFNLPGDVSPDFVRALLTTMGEHLHSGQLDTAWEWRLPPIYASEILFTMLAILEISLCKITPGWVRALERSVCDFWNVESHSHDTGNLYQPVAEFTYEILKLLPPSELHRLLESSLVLPLFFENLKSYYEELFEELLPVMSSHERAFQKELMLRLSDYCHSAGAQELEMDGRIQACAAIANQEIVLKNGEPHLIDPA